jgi:NADPH2:quinone reductase
LRAAGPGEITVAIEAAGINFIDAHRRSGALEDGSAFPRKLGVEGAGKVVDCGHAHRIMQDRQTQGSLILVP